MVHARRGHERRWHLIQVPPQQTREKGDFSFLRLLGLSPSAPPSRRLARCRRSAARAELVNFRSQHVLRAHTMGRSP